MIPELEKILETNNEESAAKAISLLEDKFGEDASNYYSVKLIGTEDTSRAEIFSGDLEFKSIDEVDTDFRVRINMIEYHFPGIKSLVTYKLKFQVFDGIWQSLNVDEILVSIVENGFYAIENDSFNSIILENKSEVSINGGETYNGIFKPHGYYNVDDKFSSFSPQYSNYHDTYQLAFLLSDSRISGSLIEGRNFGKVELTRYGTGSTDVSVSDIEWTIDDWNLPVITVSHASGAYTGTQMVTINSSDPSVPLKYSIDGSSLIDITSGSNVQISYSCSLQMYAESTYASWSRFVPIEQVYNYVIE